MGFYDISMGLLWDFHGGSLEFLRDFKEMSMGLPLDSYGISVGFL